MTIIWRKIASSGALASMDTGHSYTVAKKIDGLSFGLDLVIQLRYRCSFFSCFRPHQQVFSPVKTSRVKNLGKQLRHVTQIQRILFDFVSSGPDGEGLEFNR
ncbi:OLC1v1000789C1 [Oldenlandia corymbosa var. corymbosa]|uniref:OLC1v1000789C1 n=1 Tax=Oldenlandia corymbosa var. corymbosa TaxID=529605 RepID=A0AAV1D6H9_OLDCO|nr:OLC1v1000789C1 [Oldenlandia corymbosa var. corymbosa]